VYGTRREKLIALMKAHVPQSARHVLLFGLILAWALAGIFPVDATVRAGPALIRVSGPSPLTHCEDVRSPNGHGVAYANSEVEPYVAIDPRTAGTDRERIIGIWQQDRWSTEAARGLVAASSHDGGRSWSETPLPFTACVNPTFDETRASDPWISIGPDGRVYASGVATGLRVNAIVVATSTDGGATWHRVQAVIQEPNRVGYNDKPAITADPTVPGTAYIVWNRNRAGDNPPQPAWFSRTRDGGRSWSKPGPITFQSAPNTGTLGNQILVDARRRRMYDVFERYVQPPRFESVCTRDGVRRVCYRERRHYKAGATSNEIAFMVSRNGGDTWSRPRNLAADMGIGVKAAGFDFRTGFGVPEATLDAVTGCVYVVWEDARFSRQRYEGVVLTSSCDAGTHWTLPHPVNPRDGNPAFTPAVAISETGMVGVTYYRLRAHAVTSHSLPTDYWIATSSDGGRHFAVRRFVAGPFNMRTAPDSGGLFLGDYQALAADGSTFRPFFAVTSSGGNLANRTDVVTTVIDEPTAK
jgi:hypothetical protein